MGIERKRPPPGRQRWARQTEPRDRSESSIWFWAAAGKYGVHIAAEDWRDAELHALTGDRARGDAGVGELVLEGRTGETAASDGVRLWAGHVRDSFYVDLSLLSIVNGAVANGTALDLSGWHPDKAQNSFAGSTVRTIVLQVPHTTRSWRRIPGSACEPVPVPHARLTWPTGALG